MKNIVFGLIVLLGLTSCQEQQKIAFIDNGDVINDYQMKIDIEEKYKLKDEAFKKKMDSVSQAFQIEAQAFQLAAGKMSRKKQEEKYQELGQKQQILQQQFQYEQQQIQQAFSAEMDSVIVKVNDFVEDYGKKNAYDFILGKNQAGSVMYGEEVNDISDAVAKALNDAYKSKGDEASTEATDTSPEKEKEEPKTEE